MGILSFREKKLLRFLERNPHGSRVDEIAKKLRTRKKKVMDTLEDLEVAELVRRDDENRYFAVSS